MAVERDFRKQIDHLRRLIADDAAELRIRWEESRGRAVSEWRGVWAVAHEALNMLCLPSWRQDGRRGDAMRTTVGAGDKHDKE